jgi:HAD superfamily hydrolase (TIGR01509 family)
MSIPAAVLFDLDGTLVDSERDNIESVVLAVRRHGKELDAEDRQFVVGHSWNEIHERIARRHGLQISMKTLIAEAVAEKRGLLAQKGYQALPGAVAAVERLGRRSPLAVVSGASRTEVEDAVTSLGVRAAFAFLLGAEDYTRGKPDPEPYQMAIRKLGVAAGTTVIIEDATPGILAGRAAGARVVAVRAGNFSGYDLSAAHAIVDTLDEITDDFCARLVS